jgi:hypothetical protein
MTGECQIEELSRAAPRGGFFLRPTIGKSTYDVARSIRMAAGEPNLAEVPADYVYVPPKPAIAQENPSPFQAIATVDPHGGRTLAVGFSVLWPLMTDPQRRIAKAVESFDTDHPSIVAIAQKAQRCVNATDIIINKLVAVGLYKKNRRGKTGGGRAPNELIRTDLSDQIRIDLVAHNLRSMTFTSRGHEKANPQVAVVDLPLNGQSPDTAGSVQPVIDLESMLKGFKSRIAKTGSMFDKNASYTSIDNLYDEGNSSWDSCDENGVWDEAPYLIGTIDPSSKYTGYFISDTTGHYIKSDTHPARGATLEDRIEDNRKFILKLIDDNKLAAMILEVPDYNKLKATQSNLLSYFLATQAFILAIELRGIPLYCVGASEASRYLNKDQKKRIKKLHQEFFYSRVGRHATEHEADAFYVGMDFLSRPGVSEFFGYVDDGNPVYESEDAMIQAMENDY